MRPLGKSRTGLRGDRDFPSPGVTICHQVPVEVRVIVPVTVHCPTVLPSAQGVVAMAQLEVSFTALPACDSRDKKHPLLGRVFRRA